MDNRQLLKLIQSKGYGYDFYYTVLRITSGDRNGDVSLEELTSLPIKILITENIRNVTLSRLTILTSDLLLLNQGDINLPSLSKICSSLTITNGINVNLCNLQHINRQDNELRICVRGNVDVSRLPIKYQSSVYITTTGKTKLKRI